MAKKSTETKQVAKSGRGGVITAEVKEAVLAIDGMLRETRDEIAQAEDAGNMTMVALLQADMLAGLEGMLTADVLSGVMQLMNTRIGFLTDKNPNRPRWNKDKRQYDTPVPYGVDVVKHCVIEAMTKGICLVGNHMNIIAGQCYPTKEHYEAVLNTLCTNLRVEMSVPDWGMKGGKRAYVEAIATWKFNGCSEKIECTRGGEMDSRVVVNSYDSSSADELLGKAKRKVYARVYERITGSTLEPEDEASPEMGLPGKPAIVDGTVPEKPPKDIAAAPADPLDAAAQFIRVCEEDLNRCSKISNVLNMRAKFSASLVKGEFPDAMKKVAGLQVATLLFQRMSVICQDEFSKCTDTDAVLEKHGEFESTIQGSQLSDEDKTKWAKKAVELSKVRFEELDK